jgi:hypothetical protein
MKTTRPFIIIIFFLATLSFQAQTTSYTYRLNADFRSSPAGGPDLIQIPNNSGLTGEFTTRAVPSSTCEQGGNASGYFFEDDAGLQFNNPAGFIDQTYTLSMLFQVDELITPPTWVRILSFTHTDDVGVYILITNPPDNGTLEFWPYGTVGETNFFNTVDFYQLILVRKSDGMIKIYINGEEFAEYDDSGTQKFVPQDPDNYIVFFRDHPSVLADEASPGFISNIMIMNGAWSEQQVAAAWDDFCSSLLSIDEAFVNEIRIAPNPFSDNLEVSLPEGNISCDIQLIDLTGKVIMTTKSSSLNTTGIVPGLYFLKVRINGSSSIIKVIKKP